MVFVVAGSAKQASEFRNLSLTNAIYVTCVQDLMGYTPELMEVYYFGTYDLRGDMAHISHYLNKKNIKTRHITYLELEQNGLK